MLGKGRIGRAIKYSGTRDFFKLAETKYIVAETKRYVPKIMATAILGHYPELYGFRPAKTGEPLQYDTTTLDGAVELAVIAKCADTSVSTIKQLNPALKSFATPPSSYDLRIPVGTKAAFDKALSKIPPENESPPFGTRSAKVNPLAASPRGTTPRLMSLFGRTRSGTPIESIQECVSPFLGHLRLPRCLRLRHPRSQVQAARPRRVHPAVQKPILSAKATTYLKSPAALGSVYRN